MTKQIDIKELIPYMRKGWVACDKNGAWVWFDKKPLKDSKGGIWICYKGWLVFDLSRAFNNIAPAEDWTKSLIKIERK